MRLDACQDLAVVSFSPDVARAAVDLPYASAIDAFDSLLERAAPGHRLPELARMSRLTLDRAGGATVLALPGTAHCVGLVRPYLAAGDPSSPPVLIAVTGRSDLAAPILAEGTAAAQAATRHFEQRIGHELAWRHFEIVKAAGGQSAVAVLEQDLARAVRRQRDELALPTDALTGRARPEGDLPA